MDLTLSNKACINLLFNELNGIDRLKRDFRVLKFASNEIRSLEPFTKLFGFKIQNLDLRDNKIQKLEEFHFLSHIEIEGIFISGNDCVKFPNCRDKIFEIVQSLKFIDGQERSMAKSSFIASLESSKKLKFKSGNGELESDIK